MAEMGHAKAQYNLGAMYAGGLGTSQNNTEAVK
jgi:TPR repeat protein